MRTSVGCLVRFAVASALTAAATAALAQEASGDKEAAEPQELQEITVTGSRIVRSDFKSDSPMVSLSADVLKNTGEVGIDQQLNKLPQFVPGANQVTSAGDIQSTPTNSPGISTVNLRGLGTNRTLVLLDGRRTQPNNASLVVDINTIPSAALEGVEIITGGAGSAYGADAVAGVVNFKLKHNYEGVTLDAQSGETFRHDGAQTQLSALIGSNFAQSTPGRLFWASMQASMIFLILSYSTHRRLQPWCPWCSEGGGGQEVADPVTPDPVPAGTFS